MSSISLSQLDNNNIILELIKKNRKRRLERLTEYNNLINEVNKYKPRMYYGRRNPYDSVFYQYTVDLSYRDITHRNGKLFRRRFRVSFDMFLYLTNLCENDNWFPKSFDAIGRPSSPNSVKVLGVLRVLGRGVCFDDIEELSNISAEVHRCFFRKFIRLICKHISKEHIKIPITNEEIRDCLNEYSLAGFPGCIGSVDCVHISWVNCPSMLKNLHNGKEGYTTIE